MFAVHCGGPPTSGTVPFDDVTSPVLSLTFIAKYTTEHR